MSYVLGVDLGTTYSAAAISEDSRAEIVQLGTRQATIPSVVVLREDGEVLVGEAAERRAISEPGRVAREFKRRLGDPTPLILGGTPYGAEALMARLLESIVAQVTALKGEAPARIVVTHPASYGPYKLDLLQQAARMADAEPITLVSEPVAAAVHYAGQERIEPGAAVAVYDFGGGTFDAAVLRRTEDGFELLGEGEGLERLGGIDFDEAVYAHVANALEGALDNLDPANPANSSGVLRLRTECSEAKESLSVDTDATIPVILPSIQTDVRITRSEFETIIRPRIRETVQALERAVRKAGLTMDEVDRILLVGGSSRIPLIAEMVREATGRPVAIDAQPKHAIALGAATVGAQMTDNSQELSAPLPPTRVDPAQESADAPAPEPAVAAAVVAGASASAEPEAPARPAPAPQPVDDTATLVAPVEPTRAAAPTRAGSGRSGGGPNRNLLFALGGGALFVAAAVGGFFVLGGGGDDDDGEELSPAQVAATETAEAEPDETETSEPGDPTNTQTTATNTPTTAPTPTETRPPQDSEINNIVVRNGRYIVDFSVYGFVPDIANGQYHVHFFFDTIPPEEAGVPGDGPWVLYDVPNPFREYAVADRPPGAEQLCILVANANHSVIPDTGNCFDLPGP